MDCRMVPRKPENITKTISDKNEGKMSWENLSEPYEEKEEELETE